MTGTIDSVEKYKSFIDVNEVGFLNLLNHLKEGESKPHLIFPSTRLVYKGVQGTRLDENAEKEFKTVYAISKYAGEQYLKMFTNLYGVRYTVFRIGVPYGNFLSTEYSYGTIGFFLSRAKNNQDISLYGDGSLKRSFTHIEDVCRQIKEMVFSDESINQCFNIEGETFSLKEIANLIAERFKVKVSHAKWPEPALKVESGDTIFDSDKIKAILRAPLTINFESWVTQQ
jgi:UDP-glucose 4-epimerase